MVNKVDETVVDYFSVLLKQPNKTELAFAEPESAEVDIEQDNKKQELQSLLSNIAVDVEAEKPQPETDIESEVSIKHADAIAIEKKTDN